MIMKILDIDGENKSVLQMDMIYDSNCNVENIPHRTKNCAFLHRSSYSRDKCQMINLHYVETDVYQCWNETEIE